MRRKRFCSEKWFKPVENPTTTLLPRLRKTNKVTVAKTSAASQILIDPDMPSFGGLPKMGTVL